MAKTDFRSINRYLDLGKDRRQAYSVYYCIELLRLLSVATIPPYHSLTDNGSSQDDSPSIYFMPLGLL